MPDWIVCPHCNLKHRERPDGLCPRCREDRASQPSTRLVPATAGMPAAVLPDVYDGRPLERSRLEKAGEEAWSLAWKTLAGGLALLFLAHSLHGDFAQLASGQRASIRIWWGFALMYNIIGPDPTVVVIGLLGAVMAWRGARDLF